MKTLLFTLILFVCAQVYSQCGSIIIANNTSFCVNSTSTVIFTTGVGNYNFTWTSSNSSTGIPATGNGDTLIFTPNNAGIDTVSVQAIDPTNTCPTLNNQIIITVFDQPILVNSADLNSCSNQMIPSNSFSCSPSNPNVNYYWTNTNVNIGLAANGTGNIPPFTPVSTSLNCDISYITVLAELNGCISEPDTFSIEVCPEPILTFGPSNSICTGGESTLSVSALPTGGDFTWNTLETNDTIIVSPSSTTNYSVSYQSPDGCVSIDSITVEVINLSNLNLADTTICEGETVLLSASSNSVSCDIAAAICSNGTTTYPNLTNTSAPAGNNYDCLSNQPNPSWFYFQIEQPGDLALNISQSSNVGGSGTDVDFILYGPYSSYTNAMSYCGNLGAATSGSGLNTVIDCSYSTASIETANIVSALAGEVYLLMVTNFANEPGTISISQESGLASMDCSVVNNSNSQNNYLWTTGETTPWISVSPTTTGVYGVTVTNSGCSFTESATVNVNPVPTVTSNNETIGELSSATLTANGSPSGGTYLWNPGGETTQSITVYPVGTTSYTVIYTLNGCSSQSISVVDVISGLTEELNSDFKIYPNPSETILTIEVNEQSLGNTIEIIDQNGRILKNVRLISKQITIPVTDLQNGLYIIRIGNKNMRFVKS